MYCTDGAIRLGDDAVLKGRVEVCIDETWHKICTRQWTMQEASVVCSQLGYSPYGMCTVYNHDNIIHTSLLGALATANLYVDYELPVGILDLECNGNENAIWNCSYDITDGQGCYDDASVFCMRMLSSLLYSIIFHYF